MLFWFTSEALTFLLTNRCICMQFLPRVVCVMHRKKGIYREIYSSLSWNSSIADIHCYIMAYRNVVSHVPRLRQRTIMILVFFFPFLFFFPSIQIECGHSVMKWSQNSCFLSCPPPCGNVSTIQDHWGHNSNFGPCEKEVKYEGTRPRCMYWSPSSCPTLVEDTGFYENEASLCQNLGP